MKRRSLHLIIPRSVLALVLLILLITTFIGTAFAEAVIRISPQEPDAEDENLTVNIYIEPNEPIAGVQFDFLFDSSLVNIKTVQEGNLLKQTGFKTMFSQGTIDNLHGTVTNIYGFILGKSAVIAPNTFAVIELVPAGGSGVCKLQLSNVILSNSNGSAMPLKVVNSSVCIVSAKNTNQLDNGSETLTEEMSSGGGGGISNGESYENIKLKEISKVFVSKDTVISYQFKDAENPVMYVNYTALKNSGFITTSIEVLENTSGLVSHEPEGIVYKNLNIWVGNNGYSTEENIGNPVVNFRVSKIWLEENQVQYSTIKLNRYNSNAWSPLPTVKTKENSDYIFLESETPGFSPFAITGQHSQFSYGPENQVMDSKEILELESTTGRQSEVASSSEKETTQDEDSQEGRNNQAPEFGILGAGILFLAALIFIKSYKN